ncbi:Mrp/NBP35 family ATP-binding protein [Clostridium sp. 'deep sea']|uniref:Mrp/NBP35 family ATP-binding protein n=1 Tax=Clostridium sp. 'deep sea' TaxID=2779445 RepID=UPI001FACA7A9|nr:Mrp/NBP35 family ATP-binding protein [Clostridium sp. 'deep sea']
MIQKETTNGNSNIKKVIAVMSGKGGVGKSSMTSLIATTLNEQGYKVGIMDADITGPSIPKIFGVNTMRAMSDGESIEPVTTKKGIKVISLNLLIDKEDAPVVWRGPLVANAVKQFFTDVNWGDLDYLVIDLPPGTGDVSITLMQSIPVDGVVVVSSPQDLVKLIVKKSVNMAEMMNIAVLGLIENMSYFVCPHCGEKTHLFGESKTEQVTKELNIELIHQVPIDQKLVELCDQGNVEDYPQANSEFFNKFKESVNKTISKIK